MTTRRRDYIITVAPCSAFPVADYIRIRSPELDLPRQASGRLRPHEGRHLFVPETRFAEARGRHANQQKSMTVLADNPSPRKLLEMTPYLHRFAAEYVFTPKTVGDGTVVMMALSLNVPVRLEYGEDYDEDVLSELLDYFLHSPTLAVPLEPFFSLAGTISGQGGGTPWELYHEVLGQNYHVDSAGRVTLSRRWAEQGDFFGAADDDPATFAQSALWQRLSGLRRKVFTSQSPCAFCEHFPPCEAFYTTAKRGDEMCALWRRLLERMTSAYQRQTTSA